MTRRRRGEGRDIFKVRHIKRENCTSLEGGGECLKFESLIEVEGRGRERTLGWPKCISMNDALNILVLENT